MATVTARIPEALARGEYWAFMKSIQSDEDLLLPFVSVKVSLSQPDKATPFQLKQWDKILNDSRITKHP